MAFKFPFTNYHELNLTWVLDQLKALFEQSEENITTIETYEDRLTAVETELPSVSETASEASRAAAAAGSLAQTAKATADTAQNNAIQAQGLAGTARQEAQAAQTAANEATQAAQQAQATAQNFDGRITQAENDASQALEASRSFENRVQSAITTANNASQTATTAQGIAMRADQNAGSALDKIGDLSDLTTTAKQNLVVAINEAAQSGGSGDNSNCAPLIINTASGAIASFSDGADNRQIRKIVGTIVPVQSGTGDPSPVNKRPISGWTGAEVTQRGKNLFDKDNTSGRTTEAYLRDDGTEGSNSSWFITDYIPVKGTTFTVSNVGGISTAICLYDANKTFLVGVAYNTLSATELTNVTITSSTEAAYARFSINNVQDTSIIQLEADTVSSYEPYTGNQISVTFPDEAGTVYGGTVTLNQDGSADVVSTMGNIASYAGETLPGAWISSMDVYKEGATPTTGAQVVYELEEPVSYHFDDAGQLKTFLGVNNIWADTGDIEVTYPADTKLYIDGKLAELQALILEH